MSYNYSFKSSSGGRPSFPASPRIDPIVDAEFQAAKMQARKSDPFSDCVLYEYP